MYFYELVADATPSLQGNMIGSPLFPNAQRTPCRKSDMVVFAKGDEGGYLGSENSIAMVRSQKESAI